MGQTEHFVFCSVVIIPEELLICVLPDAMPSFILSLYNVLPLSSMLTLTMTLPERECVEMEI